jgi:nucleotide-binding universal stress UspA family protein
MTNTAAPKRDAPATRPKIGELSGFPVTVKHILAPTDLTEDARKGLRYATSLAIHFNAKLTVLHVIEARHALEYVIGEPPPEDTRQELQAAEQKLEILLEEVKKQHREVEATVVIGNVCAQIIDLARLLNSDLIVLSTHNYPWFRRLMTGSDAEKIARHAPCPILIVHQHEHDFIG